MVTGAFLAEAAATVDNKLNVQGGVLSRYTVGPDRRAVFVLVVLTRGSVEEDEDSDRQVEVQVRPPTLDEPVRTQFEVPESSVGEFPGFVFFNIDMSLPFDGRWVFEVSAGETSVSLPLVVTAWVPPAVGI